MLAAAAGLFGLLVLGRQAHGERPGLARVLAAGLLLGVAADIKINYALFGLGAAWALRRYPAALATAGAAALAVLAPSYAYFGRPAVRALLGRRDSASADNFYRLILPTHHFVGIVAAVLVIAMAVSSLCGGSRRATQTGRPSGLPWRWPRPGCSCGPTSCPGTTR